MRIRKKEQMMAHTKQEVFRGLRTRARELDDEYQRLLAEYNSPPEDIDFFSGLAYSSDSLYVDLTQLISDIHGMLNTTELKMKDKEEEFKEIGRVVAEHRSEIQSLFQRRVEDIRNSGGYLSDAEEETLKKFTIR